MKNEMGMELEAALDEAIRADNTALEGAYRPGVTLAIHLCSATTAVSGTLKAAHSADGWTNGMWIGEH